MTKTDLRGEVNTVKSYFSGLLPVFDWVDSLIGPSGLLLVVSPPICSPSFNFDGWAGLLPVSDWVDSLIGPSGLLLVVSHLFAVPISILGVG